MGTPRWSPREELSKQEQFVIGRLKRTGRLFAFEKRLMNRLVSCRPIDDDDRVWELSDHCPVVADFEL